MERYGTKHHLNVIVPQDLTGMAPIVSSASMDKVGINNKKNVLVGKELNGMDTFVLSFKNALGDLFGIKTHGHANAWLQQFGMETIVWKILVLVEESGMEFRKSVSVLVDKSLPMRDASCLNIFVSMEKYGMALDVFVLGEPTKKMDSALIFPSVPLVSSGTVSIKDVNAKVDLFS